MLHLHFLLVRLKTKQTLKKKVIVIAIGVRAGVRGGGGEEGCSSPQILGNSDFLAARENLGKASS